jgi:hypothetical protein
MAHSIVCKVKLSAIRFSNEGDKRQPELWEGYTFPERREGKERRGGGEKQLYRDE